MSWAKVDDRLFGHTKAARAGEALWLWVVALSWCCAYLTDGEVPEEVPRRLIGRKGPRYAARLVEVKLWEKTEFGYRFRSWSEYQTTRETVEASRAEAKARMQRIRGVAGNVRANNSVGSPDVRAQFAEGSRAVRDAKSESESDTESNTEKREETPPDGGVARVREDAPAAPAREGLTLSADTPAVERKRAARRAKPAPAPDPTPDPSSPAGRVYSAIVGDAALAPITRGPGDLAVRLVALCEGTGVDPLREVLALGAWLAGGGTWTDGRAGLLRAIKRKVDDAARLPKPATGTGSSTARAPERIDYQGRRVVGSAGLPPGSAWEKTRAEFEAEEDRIYADFVERTQPRRVK